MGGACVAGGLRSGKALGQETFRPVAGCCVHSRLGKTQERREGGDAGRRGQVMERALEKAPEGACPFRQRGSH